MSDIAKDVEKQLAVTEKEIVTGELDTTDNASRYLGYLGRIRPIFIASSRYLAYTSDVGESVRPVVNPKVVTGAYGISWAYLIGDVAYEGYKSRLRAIDFSPENEVAVVGLGMAKRAVFQATASMLLPSLTIHSIVRYSAIAIKKSSIKNIKVRTWAPSFLGLATIPALPYMFDEPVEHVVDKAFDYLEEKIYPDPNSPVRKALKGDHVVHAEAKQV